MLSQPVLLGTVVVLLGVIAGNYLYKKDTEQEERRKAASRLAGILRAKGMVHVPDFLENYSVGDYSGMAKQIQKAALLLEDPKHAEEMFDEVVTRALAQRNKLSG